MSLFSIQTEIRKLGTKERAEASAWYFKTGKGQYGEGDKFIGLTVPEQRKIAKKFCELPLSDISALLKSPYHEDRFTALLILVSQYKVGEKLEQKRIAKFYLTNKARINNWDLVDTSAPCILGAYLFDNMKERAILKTLAKSKSLWDRRIAIISSLFFVSKSRYKEPIEIATILLGDREDLIHKAVGWTLREIWKREPQLAEMFLDRHCKIMPRTALRYAIERMPEPKRLAYLSLPHAQKLG